MASKGGSGGGERKEAAAAGAAATAAVIGNVALLRPKKKAGGKKELPDGVIFQGLLQKRDAHKTFFQHTWQERLLVLYKDRIDYYKVPPVKDNKSSGGGGAQQQPLVYDETNRGELRGSIYVAQIQKVESFPSKKTGGRFDITITGGRVYAFDALTEKRASQWMENLRKVRKMNEWSEDEELDLSHWIKTTPLMDVFFPHLFAQPGIPVRFETHDELKQTGFPDDARILHFLLRRTVKYFRTVNQVCVHAYVRMRWKRVSLSSCVRVRTGQQQATVCASFV